MFQKFHMIYIMDTYNVSLWSQVISSYGYYSYDVVFKDKSQLQLNLPENRISFE